MMAGMGTLRISEAELARDIHAILAKVQRGAEVVVEQGHRPVAVLRRLDRSGRLISDILREARRSASSAASLAQPVEHKHGRTSKQFL
jgi:antitoxin (DNA-binding transcriptional repressor) of toxin-antitoxin stability system